MKKKLFILSIFTLFMFSCSNEDDTPEPDAVPEDPTMEVEALMVTSVNGFVSTGPDTFQVTDLLASSGTTDVQYFSPFFITFSKPMIFEGDNLIGVFRLEDGEIVAEVPTIITSEVNTEITIEVEEALRGGTNYQLIVNEGYKATDGGILEDPVFVDFTTQGILPEPLGISAVQGFILNEVGGIELVDFVANGPVTDLLKDSSIIVNFSESLTGDFPTDPQFLSLSRLENGTAVEEIPFNLSSFIDFELIIETQDVLIAGTTYRLVLSQDYQAADGGLLGEDFSVDFTVRTPNPLTVVSIVADGSNTDGNVSIAILANTNTMDVPVNAAFTITFSQAVLSDLNAASFIELVVNGTSDSVPFELIEDLQNSTITITPTEALMENTMYDLRIAEGTVDGVDGTLENEVTVSFTTEN
ncbi:Ig-like domain-containing protein [Flagellimonas eckloniae]|nr:Ig-like domain-containing protein [Allomuricauda eckloniae]